MGALALAWITGESIIIWRSVTKQHHPPIPGALLGSSAIFAVLAVVAEFGPQSARAATLAAWAFDLAAFMQVLPEGIGGPAKTSKATGTTQAPGTTTAAGRG